MELTNVNRRTRAPREGQRQIFCPTCNTERNVGHFAWTALWCNTCDEGVKKEDWLTYTRSKR